LHSSPHFHTESRPLKEEDMANIFKKVGDVAGKVADKTVDGVVATGKGATANFVKGE
jgi:hypothetical protein